MALFPSLPAGFTQFPRTHSFLWLLFFLTTRSFHKYVISALGIFFQKKAPKIILLIKIQLTLSNVTVRRHPSTRTLNGCKHSLMKTIHGADSESYVCSGKFFL